jgi:hypothetical protein
LEYPYLLYTNGEEAKTHSKTWEGGGFAATNVTFKWSMSMSVYFL